MLPDLRRFYGIDLVETIRGRGTPPSLVLQYVYGLPDESLTAALVAGGREFYGWGGNRHLLADIYDAMNLNTTATGNYKKPPKIPAYPRPEIVKQEKPKPKVSLESIWTKLNRGGD